MCACIIIDKHSDDMILEKNEVYHGVLFLRILLPWEMCEENIHKIAAPIVNPEASWWNNSYRLNKEALKADHPLEKKATHSTTFFTNQKGCSLSPSPLHRHPQSFQTTRASATRPSTRARGLAGAPHQGAPVAKVEEADEGDDRITGDAKERDHPVETLMPLWLIQLAL